MVVMSWLALLEVVTRHIPCWEHSCITVSDVSIRITGTAKIEPMLALTHSG